MSRLTDVKRLAQAATPGPWEHEVRTNCYAEVGIYSPNRKRWQIVCSAGILNCHSNAAYIAASSPDYILRLLAAIEAADAMRHDFVADVGQNWDTVVAYDAKRARLEE